MKQGRGRCDAELSTSGSAVTDLNEYRLQRLQQALLQSGATIARLQREHLLAKCDFAERSRELKLLRKWLAEQPQ